MQTSDPSEAKSPVTPSGADASPGAAGDLGSGPSSASQVFGVLTYLAAGALQILCALGASFAYFIPAFSQGGCDGGLCGLWIIVAPAVGLAVGLPLALVTSLVALAIEKRGSGKDHRGQALMVMASGCLMALILPPLIGTLVLI